MQSINKHDLARAFNKWLDNYTNNPEEFQREFEIIQEQQELVAMGSSPTYGQTCVEYLEKLIEEANE